MLSVILFHFVTLKIITPHEADRVERALKYVPVADSWRGVISQFEDALGRKLTGAPDAPP